MSGSPQYWSSHSSWTAKCSVEFGWWAESSLDDELFIPIRFEMPIARNHHHHSPSCSRVSARNSKLPWNSAFETSHVDIDFQLRVGVVNSFTVTWSAAEKTQAVVSSCYRFLLPPFFWWRMVTKYLRFFRRSLYWFCERFCFDFFDWKLLFFFSEFRDKSRSTVGWRVTTQDQDVQLVRKMRQGRTRWSVKKLWLSPSQRNYWTKRMLQPTGYQMILINDAYT